MTDNERYEVLLSELAEVLKEKNDTIYFQKIQIDNLETKLKEVEVLKSVKNLEIRKGE